MHLSTSTLILSLMMLLTTTLALPVSQPAGKFFGARSTLMTQFFLATCHPSAKEFLTTQNLIAAPVFRCHIPHPGDWCRWECGEQLEPGEAGERGGEMRGLFFLLLISEGRKEQMKTWEGWMGEKRKLWRLHGSSKLDVRSSEQGWWWVGSTCKVQIRIIDLWPIWWDCGMIFMYRSGRSDEIEESASASQEPG